MLQKLLATLDEGRLRRPFRGVARRVVGKRVASGRLRGAWLDGHLSQRLGIYELGVQRVFVQYVKLGDVVHDIGAHRGFFAVLAARLVGDSGRVVAVEPWPENLRALSEALRRNRLDRVSIVDAAVSATCGSADFYDSAGAETPSLRANGRDRHITVSLTTIDVLAGELGAPAFVKIDVEGSEADALEGANTVIAAGRTIWLIELHGEPQAAAVRNKLHNYLLSDLPSATGKAFPCHLLARPNPAHA